jgi:UMF1 family MFS transporter
MTSSNPVLMGGRHFLIMFSTHPFAPILIALSLALVAGSTQSLCRSIYARMIELTQASQMFGFHALVSKMSAVLGPLTFGLVSSTTDNQRLGMLSLLIFFSLGAWTLRRVHISMPSAQS